MLSKIGIRKITVTSAALFVIGLIYLKEYKLYR